MTAILARSPATVGLLLDLDPDLGTRIAVHERELARRACTCELAHTSRGPSDLQALAQNRDDLVGLLIVKGLLVRELALSDRHMIELLGPGDILQPPVTDASPRLGGSTTLNAATNTVMAILEQPFIRAAARWPSLLATIQHRAETQREYLAIQGLIAHLPRAEHRVLLLLWHLTRRWGYVTPNGTLLPLPLGHDLLSQLAAARRSTTTIAIGALQAEGYLQRLDDGSWLLTPAAEHKVTAIATTNKAAPVIRGTFALGHRIRGVAGQPRALRAQPSPTHATPRTTRQRSI